MSGAMRAAYARRDDEMAEREIETSNARSRATTEGERSWWDRERALFDGMSPVVEEQNPMDKLQGLTSVNHRISRPASPVSDVSEDEIDNGKDEEARIGTS